MSRALKLIYFPARRTALRLIPPLVLTYLILLPAQLSVMSAQDADQAARDFYTWAQLFLAVALIWHLFTYFLPVCQEQSRELLTALRHPDIACAIILWAEHQFITVLAYIIYAVVFPEQRMMIVFLVMQSASLTILWLCVQSLSRSALIAAAVLLAYAAVCTMAGDANLPLLLRPNCLWNEFSPAYFIVRLAAAAAECAAIILLLNIFPKQAIMPS